MTQNGATLIGPDWGMSTLRACLFGDDGVVLANKARPRVSCRRPGGDFAAAYHEIMADWRGVDGDLPAIAAGMIGSTQRWIRDLTVPDRRGPANSDVAANARAFVEALPAKHTA